MPLNEVYGSRRIKFGRTGALARREFVGDWIDAPFYAPKPGQPHPDFPPLTVDTVEFIPEGQSGNGMPGNEYTHARVVVEYTLEYARPNVGEAPRVSYEFATEVLNTAPGRVWDTTSKTIDSDDLAAATVYPMLNYTIDFAVAAADLDLDTIFDLVGKVNDDTFQNAAAETLLFEGASVAGQYNYDTLAWDYRVTYKFLWRNRSHNEVWRAPLRLWDEDAQTWVRNADGTYQYASGPAGEGDWDTTTPPLYESGDFSKLLPS